MTIISDWTSQRLVEDRRTEMLRQAEQDRLAQTATPTTLPQPVFYGPILARIGDQLIATGRYLKIRYGDVMAVTSAPTPITTVGIQTGSWLEHEERDEQP